MPFFSAHTRTRLPTRLFSVRFGLSALVLLVVLVGLLSFGRMFRQANLLDKDFITIVLHSDPVVVLYTSGDSTSFITIPSDSFVELPHGYGSYQLLAAWRLGEIDGNGGQLLAGAVQELLTVPIDGWFGYDEPMKIEETEASAMIARFKHIFAVGSLLKMKTNLTLLDRIALYTRVVRLPPTQSQVLSLADTGISQPLALADGTVVNSLDPVALSNLLDGTFEQQSIRDESFRIAILNGTSRPGLGQKAVGIIESLGGLVVRVANADETEDQCVIKVIPTVSESKTAIILRDIFNCRVVEIAEGQFREDIQLIVGTQYQDYLFGELEE